MCKSYTLEILMIIYNIVKMSNILYETRMHVLDSIDPKLKKYLLLNTYENYIPLKINTSNILKKIES